MIFGSSDDLIEAEGEYEGEYGAYDPDPQNPVFLKCDDGTELTISYGKIVNGIEIGVWAINILKKGTLFDRLDLCNDQDAEIYSDIVYLKAGIREILVKWKDQNWEKLE
jgi:hypothetical protein